MNTEQPFSVSASFALLLRLVDAGPCFAQQERGKALPRVWVLATGGTIAGTGASSTDLSNYRSGTVLGEDLVRAVPEIRKHADVKVEQIVNIGQLRHDAGQLDDTRQTHQPDCHR
jgi:L-asparaginase